MKNINRIARCAEQYRNDRLEPFGLTGSQYSVILSVCREPGITQDRLSELVYINKSNVARQLSQLEEYDYKPIIDYVDLMPVVNYCVEALSVKAQKKNVTVKVSGDECRVKGTKSLIEELVYNVVENAIKYNVENGSVDVSVNNGDKYVFVTVKDTGIGIPEKYLERVFERFFRVDKSRSKATGGTGLGLAIVKHTAEYLGGGVSIKSRENEGTEITIKLSK